MSQFYVNGVKGNFKVVLNRSCCHGNYENIKFYLSIKIFDHYIFHLPSFSLWAATFLLPWFGKWHTLTNCQNCVQPPQYYSICDFCLRRLNIIGQYFISLCILFSWWFRNCVENVDPIFLHFSQNSHPLMHYLVYYTQTCSEMYSRPLSFVFDFTSSGKFAYFVVF